MAHTIISLSHLCNQLYIIAKNKEVPLNVECTRHPDSSSPFLLQTTTFPLLVLNLYFTCTLLVRCFSLLLIYPVKGVLHNVLPEVVCLQQRTTCRVRFLKEMCAPHVQVWFERAKPPHFDH
jgi:hypothetical protein